MMESMNAMFAADGTIVEIVHLQVSEADFSYCHCCEVTSLAVFFGVN